MLQTLTQELKKYAQVTSNSSHRLIRRREDAATQRHYRRITNPDVLAASLAALRTTGIAAAGVDGALHFLFNDV